MNKIKKAIKALADYLGRDTEALRLLGEVTRLANDARTEAASLRESCESKESANQKLRSDLAAANNKNAALMSDVARAESQVRQHQAVAMRLSNRLSDLEREPECLNEDTPDFVKSSRHTPLTRDLRGYMAMLRSLRKDMRIAPKTTNICCRLEVQTFSLDDIIRDYSGTSMMTLGRFVAVNAMCNHRIVIIPDVTLVDIYSRDGDNYDKIMGPYIRWSSSNLYDDTTGAPLIRTSEHHSKQRGARWFL